MLKENRDVPARLWSRVRVIVPKYKKNIEAQVEAGCKASQGKRQAGNSLAGGKCTATNTSTSSLQGKPEKKTCRGDSGREQV